VRWQERCRLGRYLPPALIPRERWAIALINSASSCESRLPSVLSLRNCAPGGPTSYSDPPLAPQPRLTRRIKVRSGLFKDGRICSPTRYSASERPRRAACDGEGALVQNDISSRHLSGSTATRSSCRYFGSLVRCRHRILAYACSTPAKPAQALRMGTQKITHTRGRLPQSTVHRPAFDAFLIQENHIAAAWHAEAQSGT